MKKILSSALIGLFSLAIFPVQASNTVLVNIGGGGCSEANPYITDVYPLNINPSSSKSFDINGVNFKNTTTVAITGFDGTVDTVTYVSPTKLNVTLTSGAAETQYNVVVANDCALNTAYTGNGTNFLNVTTQTWYDLRSGGDTLPSLRTKTGMTVSRDANGMSFSGVAPLEGWVKFEDLGFTRGNDTTLQFVFTVNDYLLLGLGSNATDEDSTTPWNQAEWLAYLSEPNFWWGIYGNNGTLGTYQMQYTGQSITAGQTFKLKMVNDGGTGQSISLYQLPSPDPSDWDNEDTLIKTEVSINTADETNLMPFIVPPNGGNSRFIAVRAD
ncbi:MAG TPA: IPT/TIG domain-containing protein [Candidatus Gracilibacteria bacterium]